MTAIFGLPSEYIKDYVFELRKKMLRHECKDTILSGFNFTSVLVEYRWRYVGLMFSALESGSSGLGSSPDWGVCVVFLGKTLTV